MKKGLLFGIIFICLCSLCYTGYLHFRINKIVVVDIYKLVEGFKLKKDLNNKAIEKYRMFNEKIDSINGILQNNKNAVNDSKLANYFSQLEYTVKVEIEKSDKEINVQIWKRLNPMIDDFGVENGYEVIIGGNGSGNVLYNSKSIDITNKLIQYINNRYEKGN
jgi:outer membrane protein